MNSPLLRLNLLDFQQLHPNLKHVQSIQPTKLRFDRENPVLDEIGGFLPEPELEEGNENEEEGGDHELAKGTASETEEKSGTHSNEELLSTLDIDDVVLESLGRSFDGSVLGIGRVLDDVL